MRFKVNNKYVVDAKSHDDAIRVIKMLGDSVKDMKNDAADLSGLYKNDDDDVIKVTRHGFSYDVQFGEDTIFNTGWSYPRSYDSNHLQRYLKQNRLTKVSKLNYLKDSVKDAEHGADVDLDFLIKDEIEAIDGYRKMIAKTSNPQLLSVLSHILDEETEHVEELRAAQAGVYEVDVNDSMHDRLGEGKCAPTGRANLVAFAKTVVKLFEDIQKDISNPRYENYLMLAKSEYDQMKEMIKHERQDIDNFDRYWQSHKNEMMANILAAEKEAGKVRWRS